MTIEQAESITTKMLSSGMSTEDIVVDDEYGMRTFYLLTDSSNQLLKKELEGFKDTFDTYPDSGDWHYTDDKAITIYF